MPQEVIDRVESIAQRQGTPAGIEFLRRDGSEFYDIIDDATPTAPTANNENPPDSENEGVDNDSNSNDAGLSIDEDHLVNSVDMENQHIMEPVNDPHNEDDMSYDTASMGSNEMDAQDEMNIINNDETPNQPEAIIGGEDGTNATSRRVNLDVNADNIIPDGKRRRRRPPDINPDEGYGLVHAESEESILHEGETIGYANVLSTYEHSQRTYANSSNRLQYAAEHLILTQMGMNAGIKAFG